MQANGLRVIGRHRHGLPADHRHPLRIGRPHQGPDRRDVRLGRGAQGPEGERLRRGCDGRHLDLDQRIRPGQACDDEDGDGGGRVGGPARPPHRAEPRKIAGTGEEERRLGDVEPSHPGRREQGLDVVHRLPELPGEILAHPPVRRDAELSGHEEAAACRDLGGMGVDRAERFRHGSDARRVDGLHGCSPSCAPAPRDRAPPHGAGDAPPRSRPRGSGGCDPVWVQASSAKAAQADEELHAPVTPTASNAASASDGHRRAGRAHAVTLEEIFYQGNGTPGAARLRRQKL